MREDTRKLLSTGGMIGAVAAVAVVLLFTVLGGVGRQGPHGNLAWLALMLAMGCGPTAVLTLALGLAKLAGERNRS